MAKRSRLDKKPTFSDELLTSGLPPINRRTEIGYREYSSSSSSSSSSSVITHLQFEKTDEGGITYRILGDETCSSEFIWRGDFRAGGKYYITVNACNGAHLCVAVSSNGLTLDNSLPIAGIIKVGSHGQHQKFVSHRSMLQFRWFGFSDPQSGILTFQACIGSQTYSCDVEPLFPCFLSSSLIKSSLNLPENRDLFVTVTAFNNAGLNVSRSSDSFQVDTTPPVLIEKPRIVTDFNKINGFDAQFEKSVLRAIWKFEDVESPIVRHVVSLKTHHEGHTPLEYLELGAENKLTINLDGKNWLHNGDKYILVVTACNAAEMCSTSETDNLLIDSIPPHNGGFSIPMYWNNFVDDQNMTVSNVFVRWTEFSDQESGINQYVISFSRSYSGTELFNGVVYPPTRNESTTASSFTLNENIFPGDKLIVSIWAVNNAGLHSSIIRVTLTAISSARVNDTSVDRGSLEIEKHSCELHYCTKECTCAVVDKPCVDAEINVTCKEITASTPDPDVSVYGGLHNNPYHYTASSACLSGHWTALHSKSIKRFEWSMGTKGEPIGAQIFDRKTERIWYDIGLRNFIIHCLPVGRYLIHGEEYVIYVRAWYAPDVYSVFTSGPIMIDQTPPKVYKGRNIKDSDLSCQYDYDVVSWNENITACWQGVFQDAQSHIIFYQVGLGTVPRMDDVYSFTNNGLRTTLELTNLTLLSGTKYYFTVTAYNGVGLHATLSSDGFLVDMEQPYTGIVFNTIRYSNAAFQSSSDSFDVSWQSFADHASGIRNYHVSLTETVTEVSELNFTNVGLMTYHRFSKLSLQSGASYIALIKAEDAAGHFSDVSASFPKVVDTTPPETLVCVNKTTVAFLSGKNIFKHYFVKDRMYIISGAARSENIRPRINLLFGTHQLPVPTVVNHDGSVSFEYTFLSPETGNKSLGIQYDRMNNTPAFVLLEECESSVSKCLNESLMVGQIASNLLAVKIMLVDLDSTIFKVEVGAGTKRGSFQIQPLKPVYGNNGVIEVNLPHASIIHVTAVAENNAGLRTVVKSDPIILDHTPPYIEDIHSEFFVSFSSSENIIDRNDSDIIVKTTWVSDDPESGFKLCLCGVGFRHYPTSQTVFNPATQPRVCEERLSNAKHGVKIFSYVKCVNGIELATLRVSSPLVIFFHPPEATNAWIEFFPAGEGNEQYLLQDNKINNSIFVQSNKTAINFQWASFEDIRGVLNEYEYRILQGNKTVIDWLSTARRTHATVEGLTLTEGELYTTEVRAAAVDKTRSSSVAAYFSVSDKGPKISGKPLAVSNDARRLHLNWQDVFILDPNLQVSYSLIVGTQPGSNDVVDIPFIQSRAYDIVVPNSTVAVDSVNEVYIYVVCMYQTGFSTRSETVYTF